jgi:GNAT superfamily N-acetyltransferase
MALFYIKPAHEWCRYNQSPSRMHIVAAEADILERILDATFPIWNEGLTRAAYGQWNRAQLRTPWGRRHLRRFASLDEGGRVLATAKQYRFDVRVNDRDGWMAGIGAVFTPPEQRGHGHASQLVDELVTRARRDGALLAGLFSEIGAEFYARLGFVAVPLDEVTVTVNRKDGAPAMLVRAGEERDLETVAAMHVTRSASAPLALRRDASLVHYALSKKRLLAGLGPPGLRQVEFFCAEEGASAVAYIVLSVNANGWTIEEAGDRDPAGARLGAMLQVLLAREPSHRMPLIRAWWPRAFAVPPQIQLTDRSAPNDLFMVKPLSDVALPQTAEDVFYWHADHF